MGVCRPLVLINTVRRLSVLHFQPSLSIIHLLWGELNSPYVCWCSSGSLAHIQALFVLRALSLSLSLGDLLHRSNWFVQNSSCRCRRPCPIRSLALSHSFLYYFATHPMRGISIIGPASFDSACDVAYGAASRATGTDPPPPCMCVRVCMSAAMLARTPCCDVSSNQRAEPHAHTHTYAMPYRFLPPLLIYKLYLGISRMGGTLPHWLGTHNGHRTYRTASSPTSVMAIAEAER